MNKELLKGLIALMVFTTLIWSLNLNYNIIETSWIECFGGVSLGFMIGSVFYQRK